LMSYGVTMSKLDGKGSSKEKNSSTVITLPSIVTLPLLMTC
jgi:hypothetical protein